MAKIDETFKMEVEKDIDELRIKENFVRRTLYQNDFESLETRFGSLRKAFDKQAEWRSQREFLQQVHFKVFGDTYIPHAFNEL